MKTPNSRLRAARFCNVASLLTLGVIAANVENGSESGVKVVESDGRVRVTWPVSTDETGSAVFSMDEMEPLIESLGVAENGAFTQPVWMGPKVKPDFSAELRGQPISNEKLTADFH